MANNNISNPFIIQWGSHTGTGNYGVQDVQYPVSFLSYAKVLTSFYGASNSDFTNTTNPQWKHLMAVASALTTAGLTSFTAAQGSYFWIAIGQ